MNEQDLRDCFAMFALNGLLSVENNDTVPYKTLASNAYEIADEMLEARNKTEEQGIAAAKPKKARKS
jgi:hypothetical protein